MIADKYKKAIAGEEDAELDDPDPLQGFTAQYLNIWPLKSTRKEVGTAVVGEGSWEALTADLSDDDPESVAVEGWPGEGISVAACWRVGETVTVSVQDFPDVASAAAYVQTYALKRPAIVGSSLATDPAWQGVRIKPTTGAIRTSVADLARLLNEGVIKHDGSPHLTQQVLNLRTSPGSDGLRIRSTGRSDAIKAAVWAISDARSRTKGKPRILVSA